MEDPNMSPRDTRAKSNVALLQDLSNAVNGQAAIATFACGGSVPFPEPAGTPTSKPKPTCPPITLRWDASTGSATSRISFPLPPQAEESGSMLTALLKACQPATFGFAGNDILDENYRKANKLDTSMFSTNSHPHDCGIVESIQQILLPSTIPGGQAIGFGPQGVRAELYKLNIYAGPSGKFHTHVDTPRGALQFGSLVVCLPCKHEGGALRVKHRGRTVDFTWAQADLNSIQWAAFYGDCEHEVLEVTDGYRITLTYNLCYSSIDLSASPVADTRHFPLYHIAGDALREADFMPRGKALDTSSLSSDTHLENRSAFGLKVGVHPIVSNQPPANAWERKQDLKRMGGVASVELMAAELSDERGDPVELFLKDLKRSVRKREEMEDNEEYDDYDDFDEPDGLDREYRGNVTVVGKRLHGPTFDEQYEEDRGKPISMRWAHEKVHGILWMDNPIHSEFACAGLAYGNEASLAYQFSFAAILVVVPRWEQRVALNGLRELSLDGHGKTSEDPLEL